MTSFLPELEARILANLDAGDVDGAATLAVRGYGPEIFGYLAGVLRNDAHAADAFSIFSENVWHGLSTFERKASLRTWAYKVAFGAAMRIVRDPERRRAVPLTSTQASRVAAEVRSETAAHLRTETKSAIRDLRAALTQEEQTLLILRVDRDLEWREVAIVLEAEEATLRKRFERVKEKLKKLARERGIVVE